MLPDDLELKCDQVEGQQDAQERCCQACSCQGDNAAILEKVHVAEKHEKAEHQDDDVGGREIDASSIIEISLRTLSNVKYGDDQVEKLKQTFPVVGGLLYSELGAIDDTVDYHIGKEDAIDDEGDQGPCEHPLLISAKHKIITERAEND